MPRLSLRVDRLAVPLATSTLGSFTVLALLMLAGCGRSGHSVPTVPAVNQQPASPAAAPGDSPAPVVHRITNMNDRLRNPNLARVDRRMGAQAPLPSGPKLASEVGAGTPLFRPPAAMLAQLPPGGKHASFTAADLVRTGDQFEPALLNHGVAAGTGATDGWALFSTSNTDFLHPDIKEGGYGIWRFNLPGYVVDADHPSTIGLEWDTASAPVRWFLGLSQWGNNRWEWFEGGSDNVVKVPNLTDFISPATGDMLVAVVAYSDIQTGLEFLQAGAFKFRGFGGAPPDKNDLVVSAPDFAVATRGSSSAGNRRASALPAQKLLYLDWFGPVTDQGQLGSCGGHAGAGYLTYLLRKTYGYQFDPGPDYAHRSPQWTYKHSGGQVCDPPDYSILWVQVGSVVQWWRTPEEIFNSLRDVGGVSEQSAHQPWDCYERWDEAACLDEAQYFKISDYHPLQNIKGNAGISDIKYTLMAGYPVYLAAFLSGAILDNDPQNPEVYNWQSELVLDIPNASVGHNVLIVGYDDAKQAFLVRNSWGPDWNRDDTQPDNHPGYFWMSYASFRSKMVAWGFWADMQWNPATAAILGINDTSEFPPVTGLTATQGDFTNHVHLSWDEVQNPSSPVARYDLFCDDPNVPLTPSYSPTEFSGISFDPGDTAQHMFWVRAVFLNGGATRLSASAVGWRDFGTSPVVATTIAPSMQSGQAKDFLALVAAPGFNRGTLTTTWTFPAGSITGPTTLTGELVTVTGNMPGDYTGTVQSVDNYGSSTATGFQFQVAANGPTASYSGPASVDRNKVVYFDASASSADPGHSIWWYNWDWDDDGKADITTTNPHYAYIFKTAGILNFGCQVVDTFGLPSAWSYHSITVANPIIWAKSPDLDNGGTGWYNSAALVQGQPAVSYSDASALKYVRATDALGSAWAAPVTVDNSAAQTGTYTSLLEVDGTPAISYWDYTDNKLRYVRSQNASGTNWGTPVNIYVNGGLGGYTSLALINAKPAIAFYDGTNFTVKYIQATDADGTAWGSLHTVDPASTLGGSGVSLLHVGAAPAICYTDGINHHLKYVRATDSDGGAWGTPVVVDDGSGSLYSVGAQCSLWLVAGNPAISYLDTTNGRVKYVRASDNNGTAWDVPAILASVGNTFGTGPTTLRGVNGGAPAVSFYDGGTGELKYVEALDANGTAWQTLQVLDGGSGVRCGAYSCLLALPSGLPGISYNNASTATLKFIRGK